jgi:hypothetical protein
MSTTPAQRARRALLWAVGLTAALYLLPFGRFLSWPLVWFSTFAHEMGHGLAAITVGSTFHSFKMWANASGVASHTKATSALASAWISAGGLIGPAVLAAVFFGLARRARLSRIALSAFAVACAVACVVVVRNPFGWFFVGGLALVLGAIAKQGAALTSQVTLVFLAIQLSLSVFSRGDYLFTAVAETGAGTLPSDVAHIASALGGPYWMWGTIVGAFSVAVLVVGLRGFIKTATADVEI